MTQTKLDAQAAAEAGAHMGIPHDEIEKWVDSWGTGNELPMPEPRHVGADHAAAGLDPHHGDASAADQPPPQKP